LTLAPGPFSLRAVLALATAVGLFAQVAQIVMFREMLAICRGTEVFLGVVLAAGLGWTALGSLVAGLAARRAARRNPAAWPRRAWAFAAALFSLNGLLLIGQIAIARHRVASWGGAGELTFLEAVVRAVVATAPVAFLCGAEFVLALHAARAGDFGKLYQADAWGAVAGGVLFTFLLVGLLDPVTLGPALGAGLCLIVLLAGGRRWMPTGLVLGVAAAVAVGASDLDQWLHVRRWRALYPGYVLRATEDSRYGQLAVLRHPRENQHTLYMDGGLVETLPPPDALPYDERNLALLALSQHPDPKRVLLVGHALGWLPGELLRTGIEHLDALELDPALFGLARRFSQPHPADPRLHLHFADGRYFIKKRRSADSPGYDVILLQLPDPVSAFVNRYFTVEFFREARAALRDPGVLITSVAAAPNYPGETVGQLSASVLRTLGAVFPEVLVAPGETHTFVAATRRGVASLDPVILARRVAQGGPVLADVDPDLRDLYSRALFENLIVTSQVERLRRDLDATPSPINTDARPITYQYALLVWNQIVSASTEARDPGIRGGTNALFRAALRFRWAHGLILPGAVLLPALVLLALRPPWRRARAGPPAATGAAAYGILATAFATGLFGMAAEIILIYAFQSAYGYAYAQVGAIVAAFMVGLAVGARAGTRWERRKGALAVLVGVMVVYCLTLPLALRGLAAAGASVLAASRLVYLAFFVLVFVAGFLDGATFPSLVGSMRRLGSERPGAWVYAADLAGAGLGALATGALLVPVLGSAAALALVAVTLAAGLVSLAPLAIARAQPRA